MDIMNRSGLTRNVAARLRQSADENKIGLEILFSTVWAIALRDTHTAVGKPKASVKSLFGFENWQISPSMLEGAASFNTAIFIV
ncbi:uncharacterized protein CIMG_12683 [Coccidioides immitis RS]|uniref:Uncharacterized protein n=1 Tax=Coccidioides immitis (strain RS) TaxID=246410 RepID=A0A0D8JRN4_COCIM|nr:uncharacterized protein CIMG_12683 [Coccidioides immitis RS]KJF60015.1 hypothetical protein CIMG_12683 [Coccidioides immitis RS]